MKTRLLPAAEWCRLPGETAIPWRALDPRLHHVVVVERDGLIAGCVVLMQALHAEFLWVAPAYRTRVSVGRRLRAAVVGYARRWRFPTVLMGCGTTEMHAILAGLGADRLPGDHYVWNMEERTRCHQLSATP